MIGAMTATSDRMSPLDATFLHVEDGIVHNHIASCSVLEGPAPAYEDVVAAIARKLPLIPRYRQKVRFVPLQLGRPVWVDDPHFRLEYHVRHTALPPPGSEGDLRNLMGRLMSQELDRHRPLWETWMVENLEGDRWALISKVHHCLVDGVAGTDLMAVVLDAEPEPAAAVPDTWEPRPEPSDLRLAAEAVRDLATSPFEQARAVRRALRTPRQVVQKVRDVAAGLGSYAEHLRNVETSLSGSIGPHRRWAWASATLDDVRVVRKSLGGTVNDVVLTAVTAGFRDLLQARGEDVRGLALHTLVPVSMRLEDQRGELNNLVSAIFADLPVGIDDPLERLESIRAQMDGLKGSHQIDAGDAVTTLAEYAPSVLVALAERATGPVLRRLPQHRINTVTTNVPGPQYPLYLCGRLMTDYLPYVPVSYGVRVGVAILSYDGKLAFGVTGDYDTAPDIDVLAHGIEDAMRELVKLAGERTD
jgi:diacylglycerol O-acyltransferase / wax synthase